MVSASVKTLALAWYGGAAGDKKKRAASLTIAPVKEQ